MSYFFVFTVGNTSDEKKKKTRQKNDTNMNCKYERERKVVN